MKHALNNYNGTISIGGRKDRNLRFADDIDGITGEENERTKLMQNLDTAAAKFGMEISAVKHQDDDKYCHFTKRHHDTGTEVGNSRPLQIPRCHNLR